jgi:hypothetical protein
LRIAEYCVRVRVKLGSAGKALEEAVKGNLISRNPLGVDSVLTAHR